LKARILPDVRSFLQFRAPTETARREFESRTVSAVELSEAKLFHLRSARSPADEKMRLKIAARRSCPAFPTATKVAV